MGALLFAFFAYYGYEMKFLLVFAVVFYIIQLIEAVNCSFYKHFTNMMSYEDLINYIRVVQSKAPKISMVYKNYHHYHEKGREKKRYTETFREFFRYYEYIDQSADMRSVEHVKATSLTRVDIDKIISYSVQAN